ncbi:MAG TPA: thioredoxin-dependent thiol peroxidase [Hyphomicrobiales bacterium]|nr:thioredoxin-dependent thiol peroxidase [Hyphomicrobiales bacterium]
MTLPKIGNLAPPFTLPDQHGEKHSLKDYRGQVVVVYFYPKAMTPGCTVQACGLRDSHSALEALNIEVLGISNDPVARLAKFEQKEKLNFTLLSDEDHSVSEAYGVWGLKKFMGREYMGLHRTTFIIDAAGKLRHVMEKVNTKTHHDDVLAWVREHLE